MSLADSLRRRIQANGPITFRDWMATALYDPEEGYYCSSDRNRWGREGDYRTSPERSRLFSATFARYFADLYEGLGSPPEFTIIEVGAGAGDFALGMLGSLQERYPHLYKLTRYFVDEPNAELAAERFESFRDHVQLVKVKNIQPIKTGIIFANELLDAFPVHRLTVQNGELLEFYVGLDSNNYFEWQLGPPSTAAIERYFSDAGVSLNNGWVGEINLEITSWLDLAASKLKQGYLILVDYGADTQDLYQSPAYARGTLRAFRKHQFVDDLLANPGGQDLTATIDWTQVQTAAVRRGFRVIEFERQDKFLLKAGLLEELEHATAQPDEQSLVKLRTEAREMILPSGMAASFQVLVLQREYA